MANAIASAPAKARVLLVDDHPIVRKGLVQLIDAAPDLQVCGDAADADSALRMLDETRPDLAVVDLSLKDRSGLDLIRELRATRPDLPVLVLSMHDENLHAERVLRAGAGGYVMKEEAAENVLEAIRKVLKGEVYLSPRMASRMLQKLVDARPGATPGASPLSVLTNRELEIFTLIGKGLTMRAIAERFKLSVKTVDTHRENIKAKLNLRSGVELLRYAMQYDIDRT